METNIDGNGIKYHFFSVQANFSKRTHVRVKSNKCPELQTVYPP